jgi:DHA3 family tetracycline resistance protein-like MFS transporter
MPSRFKLNPELTYYLMSGAMTLFDSTMFVFMTVFFFTVVGLNPLQLVLIGTVLEGSIFLFEVPTGVVADTYSRRLSVIIGILTLGISFLVMGLSRTFPVVLISEVLSGLGYTFLSGATEAWLADEVGNEKVGPVLLRSGQINRLLGILGIAVSAVLASVRLDLPILTGAVLYIILALVLAAIMPENHFKPFVQAANPPGLPALFGIDHMAATFKEGARIIRASPFLITLVVINFFVGTSSEGFDRLGDPHLITNFIFPALVIPLLGALKPIIWFSIISLAGSVLSLLVVVIFRPHLERLTTDLGLTARALITLNLVIATCGVGFALAGSFPLAVVCLLLRGLAGALIWPLFTAYQVQSVPAHVRATVLSMTGQGNALGQVVGGPLVGWIGTRSLRAALVVAGLLILPNSFLYRDKPATDRLVDGETQKEQAVINPEGD